MINNKNALRILNGGNDAAHAQPIPTVPNQSWMTSNNADPMTGRGSAIRPRHIPDNTDQTMNNLLAKCDSAEMTDPSSRGARCNEPGSEQVRGTLHRYG